MSSIIRPALLTADQTYVVMTDVLGAVGELATAEGAVITILQAAPNGHPPRATTQMRFGDDAGELRGRLRGRVFNLRGTIVEPSVGLPVNYVEIWLELSDHTTGRQQSLHAWSVTQRRLGGVISILGGGLGCLTFDHPVLNGQPRFVDATKYPDSTPLPEAIFRGILAARPSVGSPA